MTRERFEAALQARRTAGGSIGTLGERTLHAVLKHCYEPDPARHEVPVGPYVADIRSDAGIIEIQTRGFDKLRGRMDHFLALGPVTVVYPVAAVKWLVWCHPATGELTKRRKSPKGGCPQLIFNELYWLQPWLHHPRLGFRVALLEIEEVRLLNGYSADGKRGSHRAERLPVAWLGEVTLDTPADYAALVPGHLAEPFTAREYARACGLPLGTARNGVRLLAHLGALAAAGRRGREKLYLPAGR